MFPSGRRSPDAVSRYQCPSRGCRGGRRPGRSSAPRPGGAALIALILLLGSLGLGGTGCASRGGAVPERRSLYLTEHPEVPGSFAEAIMAGQIMIGMTPDMVSAAWGKPQRTDRRDPPRPATAEEAEVTSRIEPDEVGRTWNVKYVYGNYLVNAKVSNLYFVADRLKLIEYVDTKGQNSISVSDPGTRIPTPGSNESGGPPAKG